MISSISEDNLCAYYFPFLGIHNIEKGCTIRTYIAILCIGKFRKLLQKYTYVRIYFEI